jgi:arylsulfatase A-like enzyme
MKYLTFLFTLLIASTASDCSNQKTASERTQVEVKEKPNILLIIADDLGSDAFSSYGIGKDKPRMPNIENLASSGLRFTNFWAYPTCTPTRASIITGKHAYGTDMRQVGDELNEDETILQKFIAQQTNDSYTSAVIGKWHLSDDANHPNKMGLEHFSGLLSGGVKDYSSWRHTENGVTKRENSYITTKFTDLAIDWVNKQEKPWFLWLAYTAPHTPFHLPPNELHSSTNLDNTESDIENNPKPYFFSMIEALDTEIGRLLNAIPKEELDNTTIIFIGDNGSPNQVVQSYGKRKAKGSIYQGGINVPLVVWGKDVERTAAVEDALVNSTDLFATIAHLAETGIDAVHDSKSIVPLFSKSNLDHKSYLYSELGSKRKTGYTIRNEHFKYLKYDNGTEELFDLENDPYETNNLIQNSDYQIVKQDLIQAVTNMRTNDVSSNNHEHADNHENSESHNHSNSFSVNGGIECTQDLGLTNNVQIFEQDGYRIIQSNGIPDHSVGQFPNRGNPHAISEQNIEFKVSLNPKKSSQLISIYSGEGFGIGRPNYVFGIVKNGIKLDPSAAEAFTSPNSREKNFNWNKEALSANNRLGDDCNNAHVQPNGEYHYHGTPWGYVETASGNTMLMIGWAADGFPIYYKWITKSANDQSSTLVAAKTSYRLRSGNRPGDGRIEPNGVYDGTYVRDFEYISNLGDLDEANGRFGVTPEFPNGTYYYVVTDDFPSVPRYFVGTPDNSFKIGEDSNRQVQPNKQNTQNQTSPESNNRSKLDRFNTMDKNNDNRISKSEARRRVLDRFDVFDKNKDGFISREEFINN